MKYSKIKNGTVKMSTKHVVSDIDTQKLIQEAADSMRETDKATREALDKIRKKWRERSNKKNGTKSL